METTIARNIQTAAFEDEDPSQQQKNIHRTEILDLTKTVLRPSIEVFFIITLSLFLHRLLGHHDAVAAQANWALRPVSSVGD